jgi:hypothetical protein
MMGLPALIKSSSASAKLERAQAEHGKADAAIIELRAKLSALDPEQDDFAQSAQTLNAQISLQEKSIGILIIQIAGLEHKLGVKQATAAKARREAAIKKATAELSQYLPFVEAFAAALLGPRAARDAMVKRIDAITKGWSVDDLELPFKFYLDVGRADRALQATIGATDEEAKEIAANFVAHECRMIAELIQSWKSPAPAEEEQAA